MKQLIDFLPVLAFFGVYLATDIYLATIALMVAAALQVAFFKLRSWSINRQMWVVFWGAMVFGAMTLAFRDPLFIQWKPTIVYWIMALAIAGSRLVGKGDYVQRALGKALVLPQRAWRALSWGWASAMAVAGVANLYVAFEFSEPVWVTYKLVSAFVVPVLLAIGSIGYLTATGQLPAEAEEASGAADESRSNGADGGPS